MAKRKTTKRTPTRRGSKATRTKKGTVTAAARRRSATYKEGGKGKFPIEDKSTARSAIILRGKTGPPGSARREAILRRAARYQPEMARRAREADRKEMAKKKKRGKR